MAGYSRVFLFLPLSARNTGIYLHACLRVGSGNSDSSHQACMANIVETCGSYLVSHLNVSLFSCFLFYCGCNINDFLSSVSHRCLLFGYLLWVGHGTGGHSGALLLAPPALLSGFLAGYPHGWIDVGLTLVSMFPGDRR